MWLAEPKVYCSFLFTRLIEMAVITSSGHFRPLPGSEGIIRW